jgi:hypothetical protein
MEKFPFSSADTAEVDPLMVTVANETGLPSELVIFPVIVLFCAIIISAGKKNITSNRNFFMQLNFCWKEYQQGSKMHNNVSIEQGFISEA